MKQTVEEAVRKYVDDKCQERGVLKKCRLHFDFDRYDIEQGFKAGAEWQSKQSPWISVNERLPEEEQKVFVLTMHYGVPYIQKEKFRRSSNLDTKERWIHGNSIVLAWLPIPSFDEILEANKDVLERIKEEGD